MNIRHEPGDCVPHPGALVLQTQWLCIDAGGVSQSQDINAGGIWA